MGTAVLPVVAQAFPAELDGRFILVTAVVVFVLVLVLTGGIGSLRRRDDRRVASKACPGCGTENPSFAHFCRQCGQRFPAD
jgi:ribosomal protein L40E